MSMNRCFGAGLIARFMDVLGGLDEENTTRGKTMKKVYAFGSVVMVCAMLGMSAYGQDTRQDIRTGDVSIGDIRTGDIAHHTHVHVPRYDEKGYRTRGRVGLALHGIFIPKFSAEVQPDGGGSFDFDMARVLGGGAAFIFPLGEVGRFDIGADYLPMKWDEDSSVKIRMIPVYVALRFGIPLTDTVFIYGGGGGGYSFNEYRGPGFSERGDDFVYFACGGVEVLLTNEIGLRAEGRKYWHKYEVVDDVDLKLDHFQVRAGIVFWF